MSDSTIYTALRNGGLSHAGACAVMGNMYCESLMKSNIVETRCPMSGADYTWNVDNGSISEDQFIHDSYGYGLIQWTFYSRKDELFRMAKNKGVSISDETMQCELCITELRRDYNSLYNFLCGNCDLYTATSRVCCEFERPAFNNIAPRFDAAQRFYGEFDDFIPEPSGDDEPVDPVIPTDDSCEIQVRILRKGHYGRDVYLLQRGLEDTGCNLGVYGCDGDFGACTEAAVKAFQEECGLDITGIADGDVWQILFQ